MLTFHKLAWIHHGRGAVFRVLTREAGEVYMCVHSGNEARSVLLALWRYPGTRLADLAYGKPRTWRRDYKFTKAADGFAEGEANPVPLAEVGCELEWTRRPIWHRRFWLWKTMGTMEMVPQRHFDFGNGATRTIWLLTHGTETFPIACSTSEAPLLQALAGAEGGGCATVAELVPGYRDEDQRLQEIREARDLRGWRQRGVTGPGGASAPLPLV